MGKFIFRLESLVKITENREKEAEKYLGICIKELKVAQEQLLTLSHKQTEALRTLVEGQQGKISIHKLISNHQYCQYLKAEVEKKQKEVIGLENKVELARKKLQDVMKQYKILDKLKDKQYANFKLEDERRYQSEMDEMANNLFYTSAGGL